MSTATKQAWLWALGLALTAALLAGAAPHASAASPHKVVFYVG